MMNTSAAEAVEPCANEEWVAENPGSTIKWARAMWWCDCPKCELPVEARGARRG